MNRVLVVSLVTLVACVPYPHSKRVLSETFGTLHEQGQVVAGARVVQSFGFFDGACSREDRTTHTDSNGRFYFPARVHRSYTLSIDDLYYHTNFCAETSTGMQPLRSIIVMNHERFPQLTMVCDFSWPYRPSRPGSHSIGVCLVSSGKCSEQVEEEAKQPGAEEQVFMIRKCQSP